MKSCYHCGNEVETKERLQCDNKVFCCVGCLTVYEILSENDLTQYYQFEKNPGVTPRLQSEKFSYLEDLSIVEKIIDFQEGELSIVHLYIPQIHCSSCIWILEHLHKLNSQIGHSQVNFSKKTVTIHYNHTKTSLKEVVELLSSLGYEPYISLEQAEQKKKSIDRSLLYKIGIAFFGFGNIMLLSFPEYFGIDDFWMEKYRNFFRYLNVALATPVFFYSASPYFISAFHSLKAKSLNIDVPMAFGILVMYVRSLVDIFFLGGAGFLDSMCGLVFFMLSGKLIQQTTYNFLSFERDYKSYFPIAVTQLIDHTEKPVQVYNIQKGDHLLIRNEELIPVDSILISDRATIDYSFVTGESNLVEKKSGEKIYAGGKQIGGAVEITAIETVSQSYLTELWSNEVFQKNVNQKFLHITDRASKIFTPILLSIAVTGLIIWSILGTWVDAFNVFTAVLIVACPCAIALTAPYTWGNSIRILGKKKFYLKNTIVIEQLSQINTIVFDKTGTLTSSLSHDIVYEGDVLTNEEKYELKNIVRASNHPLSRKLYQFLPESKRLEISNYQEVLGKGIEGSVGINHYKIGSYEWLGISQTNPNNTSNVYIMKNGNYIGTYSFHNQYREGIKGLLKKLKQNHYELHLLSGDNDGEKNYLQKQFPEISAYSFNQKPSDKLAYIKQLQLQGKKVMMVGDGLNDAGALAQSDVGISVSEDVNVFTPASDAIIDASRLKDLPEFLRFCKQAMQTIGYSYGLAITYNIIGICFALSNHLSPLVAAIIMPLSTATIISFVTLMTNYFSRKINQ